MSWNQYKSSNETRACFCVGPQNGDPVCPCRMGAYNHQKLADLALKYCIDNGIKFNVENTRNSS